MWINGNEIDCGICHKKIEKGQILSANLQQGDRPGVIVGVVAHHDCLIQWRMGVKKFEPGCGK